MKKKWVLFSASVVIAILVVLALLHFPQVMIAKALDHGPFTVYSPTPLEAPDQWRETLDSALVLLSKSELYDSSQEYQLYMASGTAYERLLSWVGWDKPFAFAFLNRQIYLASPQIKEGIFTRNDNEYERRSMIQLIVHESVHCQQEDKGVKRGIPPWINEGYAEYVSHWPIRERPGYYFSEVVREVEENRGEFWLKSDYGYWDIWEYKYYRSLVEYLIHVKGLSIEDIITRKDELIPEVLFQEIKNYYGQ